MVQTGESPPFDLQAYEPPLSLWKLVEQHVPEHELGEIKNMLGESIVDQSLELHDEIETLLEIWRDYREETSRCKKVPRLPEPPGLRDRLIQEIQFFVDNVKDKAKQQGVNPEKILSRHNTQVLDYVLDDRSAENSRPSSRQLTARSIDGRETPMIISPVSSDRFSGASSLSEEVDSMNDKLTVLKFDEVVNHLRQTLEEETETLMRDINFLQGCLDDEATFRAESVGTLTREPTLTDLREERSTLEKELLSEMKTQTSPTLKPAFTPPGLKKLVSPPSSAKPIRTKQTSASPLAKPGPLKAFTSPTMISNAGDTKSPPGMLSSAGDTKSHTVQDGGPTSHVIKDRHKDIRGVVPKSKSQTEKRTAHAPDHSHVRDRMPDIHNHKGALNVKTASERLHSKDGFSADMSLEAVVTISKGRNSDSPEIKFTPSPPPSGKPPTPRPSSAQRFRQMVLESRDSQP